LENLKELIEKDLLPYITKPGRFLGNEIGAAAHPRDNRVSAALAFPDLYDLGMSNLGLSILYHLINNSPNGRAERVFAVSDDVAEIMRSKNIPLFSLETKTAIKNFDLVGFNSATELNYTNILAMLDLAGIPLLAAERSEDDPLVVIGGGCAFNPEPMADFADFFFLGDAEEAILEIINSLNKNRELSRIDKLKHLAEIEGVYVPLFYADEYDNNGDFSSLTPTSEEIPSKIKARAIKELKNSIYPKTPVVPYVEVVHDRLPIEIMRGCGHACRFCQATVIYKPARARRVDNILAQSITSLEKTGYDELTLLSLSSGDYPEIEKLVRQLVERLEKKHVTISLPSLRISSLSLELARMITENRKTGLTFAPEAGTERLRKVIRKPLDEETLTNVLTEAFKQGWQTIKLYFMIGLPTETEEDLNGIAELVNRLCRISDKFRGRRNFNITISTFSPKSHTPWQWERQISVDETFSKIDFLKQAIRQRNVTLKFHNPRTTWLEGILGRGDRKLGRAILRAYRLGAHMDGWSETFNFDVWQKAFEEENINPEKYLQERSTGKPLPWDHIEKGLSKESLLKELAKSRGLTEVVGSLDRETDTLTEPKKSKRKEGENQISYGRTPKTLKTPSPIAVPQSRLRVRWGRNGLARFLSHLDNIRAIERALRRANLPIAFSQGYRPKPKLSYGPPLALGLTSEAEYLDVQLEMPIQAYMINNLGREFPPGFQLLGTKPVLGKAPSLSAQLNIAVYEVILPFPKDKVEQDMENIMSKEEFRFLRDTKSGPVEIEARKSIISLDASELNDGNTMLTMQTGMADLGFIKPQELLENGFGISREGLFELIIHRKGMLRFEDGNMIDPFDLL
jgi:radical SAM family uncharacterized protein/radical SAM-linked protein